MKQLTNKNVGQLVKSSVDGKNIIGILWDIDDKGIATVGKPHNDTLHPTTINGNGKTIHVSHLSLVF